MTAPAIVIPASAHPSSAIAAIVSGMAISSRRTVGRHRLQLLTLSIRSPVAKRTTITAISLVISQMRGETVGSSAAGIPGMKVKLTNPRIISIADEDAARRKAMRGTR
jgi:hypothetical protein